MLSSSPLADIAKISKARRSSEEDTESENEFLDSLGSSVISERTCRIIRGRYKTCIICGTPEGVVCHLLAKSSETNYEGWWIRKTGLCPEFEKNDMDNLIYLCRNHHRTFDRHVWTLAPSMADLNYLISFETHNYEERERLLKVKSRWTDRQLPPLSALSGRFVYLFLKSVDSRIGLIGSADESCTSFGREELSERSFSQIVTYRDRGDDAVYPPKVHSVPIFVNHDKFSIELGFKIGYINPFACLVRALEAFNNAFIPLSIILRAQNSAPRPVQSQIPEFEHALLHLRSLYNRILPKPTRVSTETIRPPRPFAPSIFPRVLNVHGGGTCGHAGDVGMLLGAPPTYPPHEGASQGIGWGVLTEGKARRFSRCDEDIEDNLYMCSDPLGSSAISDRIRLIIGGRYRHRCVLCGSSYGQVCRLVARSDATDYEGWWIRGTGLGRDFKKNDLDNLIFLCNNHHAAYDRHVWTLIPSMVDLNHLISFEMRDYEQREQLLRLQGQWTERHLPPPSDLSGRFTCLFLKNCYEVSGSIGTVDESCTAFDEQLSEANFPQIVTYRDRGYDAQYPPQKHSVPVSVDHQNLSIELGFEKGHINPFACMAHALEALNTSFVPPSLILQVQNQPSRSIQSQIPDFERTLLHLRSLYNRILPKPTRASTETIRPRQPFAPPVFPQVRDVHSGGAFVQPGYPGMPFGVPPTYPPTQSTNQGMNWGVVPHRFGVTPVSPTAGDPRYPAGTHVQQPYQGHGGAGAGPSGSSHGYPGPAGSSSSRRY